MISSRMVLRNIKRGTMIQTNKTQSDFSQYCMCSNFYAKAFKIEKGWMIWLLKKVLKKLHMSSSVDWIFASLKEKGKVSKMLLENKVIL